MAPLPSALDCRYNSVPAVLREITVLPSTAANPCAFICTANNLPFIYRNITPLFYLLQQIIVLSSREGKHRPFIYCGKSPFFRQPQHVAVLWQQTTVLSDSPIQWSGLHCHGFSKWVGYVLTSPCSVDGTLKSINQLPSRSHGRSSCVLKNRAVFVT